MNQLFDGQSGLPLFALAAANDPRVDEGTLYNKILF